ncbi:antA/AntB antirepressor family protein [Lachnospiraceae bacterium 54-53]
MVKKFSKRQLLDQCGFDVDEAKIILEYQKKLPVLAENDGLVKHCANIKDLYIQLQVKTRFSRWVENNLINNFDTSEYSISFANQKGEAVAFEDHCGLSSQKLNNLGVEKVYMINLDCAKEIAMFAGTALHANDELKKNSKMARKYFILMEKAVKKNMDWELIRNPLREGYKKMQEALNAYMNRMIQKDADEWDYKIEANALNIIATGFSAQEIRLFVGCKDNITRDSLTATYNEYLMKLQEWNILCLGMNMNRYERYLKLKEFFDITFPNAELLRNDMDVNKIRENKNKIIEEAKSKLQTVA